MTIHIASLTVLLLLCCYYYLLLYNACCRYSRTPIALYHNIHIPSTRTIFRYERENRLDITAAVQVN